MRMVTNQTTLTSPPVRVPQRVETLAAHDGLRLAVEHFGDEYLRRGEPAPTLIFAHGFGQTRHAWDDTATALAQSGWHCVTADARGHGDSEQRADGQYHYAQFIDDLVRIARHGAGSDPSNLSLEKRPILIGASMGGLLGLSAQALHASLFRALVLVDITPRWEAAGVARIIGFMRAHPLGFANLDEAGDAIASYLPHRAERKSPARLRQLLIGGDDGRLRWHWDPRLLDYVANESELQQAALLEAARQIRIPTLLISGAQSDIVSNSTITEFLEHVPHALHVRVEKATHMVAGDANDAFARAVMSFVQSLDV
jgi:pimeloyl-ACP methyl ester carboxylesterase